MIGGGGSDIYQISANDTSDTITNGVSSSNSAAGQIDYLGSVTNQNLWFIHSGNNLIVDVLGTTNQVTVNNWYTSGDTYAQVAEVEAGNLKLGTQLATLVQAMATYSSNHVRDEHRDGTNASERHCRPGRYDRCSTTGTRVPATRFASGRRSGGRAGVHNRFAAGTARAVGCAGPCGRLVRICAPKGTRRTSYFFCISLARWSGCRALGVRYTGRAREPQRSYPAGRADRTGASEQHSKQQSVHAPVLGNLPHCRRPQPARTMVQRRPLHPA